MTRLSEEWQYFQKHESAWTKSHHGQWVCIHKGQVGGFFGSQESAIDAALQKWPRSTGRIGVYLIGEQIESIPLSELAFAAISIPT